MVQNHMHVESIQKRNDTAWRERLYSAICKGAQGSQQEGPAVS